MMQRHFGRSGAAAVMVAALSFVCLSGCGGSDSPKHDDPYAAQFESARASTDDPALLKILDDDKITDEEYAQAQQMDVDCNAEKGLRSWPSENGGMTVENTLNLPDDQYEAIMQECDGRTVNVISPLYWAIRQNPQKEEPATVVLKCLKKFDLVDESMTSDELKAVDWNNPPWNPLSGDAYGCISQMAAYAGGQPDFQPDSAPNYFEHMVY